MKFDLKDTTFLIPIRIDSIDRLENALAVIGFLKRYFYTNIIVLEASRGDNNFLKRLMPKDKDINYMHVYDEDPIFYRTHYINIMAKKVTTPIMAIWDADVLAPTDQILTAVEHLRLDIADVAHPYDGTCLEASDIIRRLFLQTKDFKYIIKNSNKMKVQYHPKSMTGGGLFIKTAKYIAAGMENELFYGWGPEDFERYDRWKTFDYRLYRTEGFLYHLTHQRDINSRFNSSFQMNNLNLELFKTRNFSQDQLITHLNITRHDS